MPTRRIHLRFNTVSKVAKRRLLLTLLAGLAVGTSTSLHADDVLQLQPPLNAPEGEKSGDQSWTRRGAFAPESDQVSGPKTTQKAAQKTSQNTAQEAAPKATTTATQRPAAQRPATQRPAAQTAALKGAGPAKLTRPIPTQPISGPLDRFRSPLSMLPSHTTSTAESKPELKAPGEKILDELDAAAEENQGGWQGRKGASDFLPREATETPVKPVKPDGFRPSAVDGNWVARDAINRVEPLQDPNSPKQDSTATERSPVAEKSADNILIVPPTIESDSAPAPEAAVPATKPTMVVPDGFAPRGPMMPSTQKSMSLEEAKGATATNQGESEPRAEAEASSSSKVESSKPVGDRNATDAPKANTDLKDRQENAKSASTSAKPRTESANATKKPLPKRKPVKNIVETTPAKQQRTTSSQQTASVKAKAATPASKPAAKPAVQAERSTVGDIEPDTSPVLDYTGRPTDGVRLTRSAANMRRGMERVLKYFYDNPEIASGRSNWGMMHSLMVYGADTKVIVGRRKYSAIAWIAGNNNCRGQRLLTHDDKGIQAKSGVGLQGHQGQFLAVLGMCNVPLDYPLYAGKVQYSVAKLLESEKRACREGEELTFTLIGLSHYLDTDSTWTADDGQVWSFEKLIEEELKQPIVGAACGGTHRLMGYAHALRKRRAEGKPITGQWRRAEVYTNDFIRYAYSLQNRDGSMSTKWFEGRADNGEVDRKIQTTGHMVEWLLSVTPDDKLQDRRLVAAVSFLLRSLASDLEHDWSIGPKGHALRSLAMYHQRVFKLGTPWIPSSVARSNSSNSRR